jgi:DNA-directed RNA polymerase specialized sigma24 family protein
MNILDLLIYIFFLIFKNKELTIFESIISYLREKEIRYSEIARLLNRDQRNIWTIYSRAGKKMKEKED